MTHKTATCNIGLPELQSSGSKFLRNHLSRDMTNQQSDCAPSEDSDQPGHSPSLIRVFALRSMVAKDPSFLHADSEDSDQTGRMHMSVCWFCRVAAHL